MTMDTAIGLETPEGTEIDIHPAGICVRSLAFLIDELLRWTAIAAGFMVARFLGLFGEGLALIVFFVIYWLFGVVFEVLNNGQTPGKKLQGLQVVHADGTPIQLPASLLRNLLLWVDLLPLFYVTGLISMTLSPRFQRVGDLAADTLVIYRPTPVALAGAAGEGAATAASPAVLSQAEQAVLVDFLERRDTLSTERAEELAGLLVGALDLAPGDATSQVSRLALTLRGG